MVLLTVIYIFVPLLAFIKSKTSQVAWEKGTFIFFIWTMLSFHYGNSLAAWSLSNMYLLGYVLLGNVIHHKLSKYNKNNRIGFALIALGILILALDRIILKSIVMNGDNYYNKLLNLYGAPLIIIGSIVIFSGFSLLYIAKSIIILSSISYIVYLSHKLLVDIIAHFIYPYLEKVFQYDVRILIPVEFIIVLPLSICLGFVLFRLLNMIFYRRS